MTRLTSEQIDEVIASANLQLFDRGDGPVLRIEHPLLGEAFERPVAELVPNVDDATRLMGALFAAFVAKVLGEE
jgi:hypothetical protein